MKKQLPLAIVFIAGLVMVLQYFVPHRYSELLFEHANDWVIVIGILSLPIGIFSLVNLTVRKARFAQVDGLILMAGAVLPFLLLLLQVAGLGGVGPVAWTLFGLAFLVLIGRSLLRAPGERGEAFYAVVTLLGFFIMVLSGLKREWANDAHGIHRQLFQNALNPAQSSLFAMLAFYIASAAYRAFRVRTALAAVLLLTAFVIMLRIIPLPGLLGESVSWLVRNILAVPNLAAKRAIIIGVALGGVSYSIKILLGIERSYMGRD